MKYSLMITSLFGGRRPTDIEYYYTNDHARTMYCDAMLAAEASSKYMLANHHIDEIITLGSKSTYDPGDEVKQIVLREGSSFYSSDIESLSTYSLLRYRLAQYIDEIRIEDQDIKGLLGEEEQKTVREFLRRFFRDYIQKEGNAKYNRYFDILKEDTELRKELFSKIKEEIPEMTDDSGHYRAWILNYLYDELKDTAKLELLDGNEDVRIRFIPTEDEESMSFAENLLTRLNKMRREYGEDLDIDLYVCVLSEDASDSFALMNLIDAIRSVPSSHITIRKIVTAAPAIDDFANSITDDTKLYSISDLLSGSHAFLRYGKTDLLMDYWKKQNIENVYIERLLYAMRNIDTGISLCDISDIERGIDSLRSIFAEGDFKPGDNIVERYFDVIIDGIKEDYGVLVTGENVNYIDFVKWAYHKGFWQQTLTLIESRAPDDLVKRGIFYYLSDEADRDQVVRIFGEIYYNLKIFEKYKLDDINHYFIKFYGRGRVDRMGNPTGNAYQRLYTKTRMSDLETDDDDIIRAHTNCTDTESLRNLLYAYYVLGDVRNQTNHASNGRDNEFGNVRDADMSERVNLIKQTIENFINSYDKAVGLLSDEPQPVLSVSNTEIMAYAQTLKPNYYKRGEDRKRDDRRSDDRRSDDRRDRSDKNK